MAKDMSALTDRLALSTSTPDQNTGPTRTRDTQTIALEYRPGDSERLPWTITVNGTPTVQVADPDHFTDAIVTAHGLIADGWTAVESVRRALQDTAALTLDQWEDADH